ncbi:MAG TPA: pyruvate, water dikinase regulatory protein [Burkholderiales bacterium]|jgi:[pyruvate, water dikinase]-phosphate phosphotransferase / [pyruvate, water dikinase] kinase|nr:pyruvate, water dikinase regulatory protein [Burkholderiales bacterium]
MPERRRTVFFVSDGTGITVEMLGHSLLTQFDGIEFDQMTVPFIDSVDKARTCVTRINEASAAGNGRPVVFTTLVNAEIRETVRKAEAFVLDFFESFLDPLEAEFGAKSTHTIGRSHSARDEKGYTHRIDAINFALAHDDGASSRDLDKADVILVGVSRSGKTPTSLYLSLQFGIRAANCPLIPEDFDRMSLPTALQAYRRKLYGLSIAPERLREIRNERRPNSKYADLENCRYEVQQAEKLMSREGIRWANSTTKSIEEIATTIMQEFKLERRGY